MPNFYNFDGSVVGTLPAGFVDVSVLNSGHGDYRVETTGATSSPNGLQDQSGNVGSGVLIQAAGALADVCIQYDQRVNLSSGSFGGTAGPILRAAANASSGYAISLDFFDRWAFVYGVGGTGYIGKQNLPLTYVDGSFVTIKAEVQGIGAGNLRFKIWPVGTTEPTSWSFTVSDSSLAAAGYVGVVSWQSNNNGSTTLAGGEPCAIDNVYVGSAGSTFSGGFVAPTLSVGTVTPTGATLSWTAATQSAGTPTYQLMRSSHGSGAYSAVAGATASPATDTTASASTAYDYRVVTSDGLNATVDSNVASITTNPVTATTFLISGPASGTVATPSANFAITPNAPYTGTVTITPSGGGLSIPIVFTFSSSSATQSFTITPASAGTVTLTPTNGAGLSNPEALAYVATTVKTFVTASGEAIGINFVDNSGNPSPLLGLVSADDVQTIALSGIPAGAGQTATLTFNGQTTTPLVGSAAPSSAGNYGLYTMIVTPGVPVALAVNIVGGPNNSSACRYDIIDGPTVVGTQTVDQSTGTPDDTSTVGGIVLSWKHIGTYTPVTSILAVLVTDSTPSGKFIACNVVRSTVVSSGVASYYDDAGSSFTTGGLFSFSNASFYGGMVHLGSSSFAGPAYQFTASSVQSALLGLSTVQAGGLTVAQVGNSCVVSFGGPMANASEPTITATDPAVVIVHTTVGANVPAVAINGGPVLSIQTWVAQAGLPFALAPLPPGTNIQATDTVTLAIPAGWATTAAGPVPASSGPITNHVGGSSLAPLVSAPKTLGIGLNAESDFAFAAVMTFSDLARRLILPIPGAVTLGLDGYPTVIPGSILTGIEVSIPAPDPSYSSRGLYTLPNGYYTLTYDGASSVELSGVGGVGWAVTEVMSYQHLTGGVGNSRVFNVQAVPAERYSPDVRLDIYGTTPMGDGSGHYLADVHNVHIYPPNPADPTGMTPWVNPPKYHPQYTSIHQGAACLRFLDQLATNDNWLHSTADLTTNTAVNVSVVKITAPTVPAKFDPSTWLTLEVTTSAPHLAYPGLPMILNDCGTLDASDGSTFDLNGIGGLVVPISATVLHLQLQPSQNGNGRTISAPLSPSAGTLTGHYGSIPPVTEMVERCNAVSANFWLNIPPCAADELIQSLAGILATNLNSGLKVDLEYANECWNFSFQTYYWARALSYLGGQPTDIDYTYGYASQAAHVHAVFLSAWVAAGRSAGDIVRVYASQGGNASATTAIVARINAAGSPIDALSTAVYFDNAPFTGVEAGLQPLLDAMTAGQGLDYYEQMAEFGGTVDYCVGAHKAILIANGHPTVSICCYEGGPDLMTPGNSTVNAIARSAAMIAHPRIYGIWLRLFQKMQDDGATLFNIFFDQGTPGLYNGIPFEWGTWNAYLQSTGTGNWVTDAVNIATPTASGQVKSQVGGAMKLWNSLFHGSSPNPTKLKLAIPGRNGQIRATGYPRGLFRPNH